MTFETFLRGLLQFVLLAVTWGAFLVFLAAGMFLLGRL